MKTLSTPAIAFRPGQLIRLIKSAACHDAEALPGSWADWVPGSLENSGSLPVDYEMVGILLCPITVGESFQVWRHIRNGVLAEGLFQSTCVRGITGADTIATLNSIYKVSAVGS